MLAFAEKCRKFGCIRLECEPALFQTASIMPSLPNPNDSWSSEWVAGLIEGDSVAIQKLWDTYFHRMVRLAKTRLHGDQRAIRDEEDIALSAFKSFCLGLRRGRYADSSRSPSLWPLLVSLTLNKAKDQIRSDNRQKRGGSGKAGDAKRSIDPFSDLTQLAGRGPAPDMEAAAKDTLRDLLDRLSATGDDQLSHIALSSMEGSSSQEIADELNCTMRTIQRKLKTIRAIWERHLG